jgi:hypothetical protein
MNQNMPFKILYVKRATPFFGSAGEWRCLSLQRSKISKDL